MSRKKKPSKDPWVNFVRSIFSRKRADRSIKIPVDYLSAVADQIHKTNPSKQIIFNTIKDVFIVAFEKGWERREEAYRWFRDKRTKRETDAFNEFKDSLDDFIHSNNEQPK